DDIRGHTPVFDPEPLAAGTAPAGLHLVADPDPAVVADDLFDDLEILFRRSHKSADTLNRLRDEGGDPAAGGGSDQFLHVLRAAYLASLLCQPEWAAVAVGIVGVDATRLRGPEFPRRLSGDGHRHRGTPVVRMPQCDDLCAPGVAARREDRGFVCLRPAVGEE